MADSTKLRLYGSNSAGTWYYFQLTQLSQSIADNSSVIRLTHIAYTDPNWGAYDIPNLTYITPTVDGSVKTRTKITNAPYISKGSSATILTQDFTVYHNADGTKTVSVSCLFDDTTGGGSAKGTATASLALTTIPRASTATLSANSVTANGSYIDLTINKASSAFTTTLTWKYGNATDTLLNKSAAASARFTPNPATLYAQGLSGKVYFYLTTYSGTTQIGNTQTYEANLTIPAVSTIRATDANIGAVSQLTITRNSTAYTHSVSYAFSNLSAYIKADGGTQGTEVKYTNTSVGFAVPTTFYAKLPSANNGKVTVYVNTYYGNSKVGSTQSAEFTVYVTGSNPTITGVTIADQNATTVALTGDASKQVRYYSNTKISFTASAKNSASIAATSIGGVGTGATGSPARTINAFEGGGVALGVTDSRGNGASATATPTMVNYVKLTTNHRVYRPQPTDGTARIVFSGDYWAGNFGTVANTLTLRYRWKPVGGSYSSWINVTASVSGGKYTATVNLTDFNYQEAFQFNLSIADKLRSFNVEDTNSLLRAGEPVCDWGKKDFNFNVPVTVTSKAVFPNPIGSDKTYGLFSTLLNNGQHTDTYFQAYRTDTGRAVSFGIGSGGENAGVLDFNSGTWMLYKNREDRAVFIPHPLKIDGHGGEIGERVSNTHSAYQGYPTSGVWTQYGSITLTAGVWLVIGKARFSTNGTGMRGVSIDSTPTHDGSFDESKHSVVIPANSGDATFIEVSIPVSITQTSTLYLFAMQRSGGNSVNVLTNMYAIRQA